jgi:uncharacterized phiE125 gp8 family phage protein
MDFKVITDVDAEPITLAEARLQCKVDADDTSHDAALTALITAAREFAEHYTGRAFAPRTLEAAADKFPCGDDDWFDLPLPPVTSVTSVKYTDQAGAEQTISPSAYFLITYGESRRIAPTYANYWPTAQDIPAAVRIRFVCGYGLEGGGPALPKAAKQAMLLHIELESPINPHTPQHRESVERSRDALLGTLKIWDRF